MKDVLILILMIAFGFFANAQIEAYSDTKTVKSTKSFRVNKVKVDFWEFDELKSFKNSLSNGESGLEKFSINKDFEFIYTVKEPTKWEGKNLTLGEMKIEITDQPNRTALIKEINDSIDGVLEITALEN